MRRLLPLLLLATPVAGVGQTVQPAPSPDDNAQLTSLFDADQHDRKPDLNIDPVRVSVADDTRRTAVRAMLDAGTVKTGVDYWHAAFIFQHGYEPRDFLLAHVLAVTAVARGKAEAAWISAATLDRYLGSVGQSQVYGTQFHFRPERPTTQQPYDRTLIGDAERLAVGVPAQAEQEARRRELDTRRATSLPHP